MKDILKPLVFIVLLFGVPPLVAFLSGRSAAWRRLLLVIAMCTFFLQPVMTFDYHLDARNNVRGWELCWPDLLTLGLLAARLSAGAVWNAWATPITVLWALHWSALTASCFGSIDPLFSWYHLARITRGLLFFATMIVMLRDRRDFEAVVLGVACACLINERQVLIDKYQFGRFQCHGMFDHQNAMGMYMGLCGPILFACLMWQAVRPRFTVVMWAGLLASGHAVALSLSRASLLFWVIAVGLAGLCTLFTGIDRHKSRILACCVLAGLAGGALMLGSLEARVSDERANIASKRTREVMNDAARAMHAERPWLGWGLNSYAVVVNRQPFADMADASEKEMGHAVGEDYNRGVVESMYLQYLAEAGNLGYWSFLGVIIGTVLTGVIKAIRLRDPLLRACALGVLMGLGANYVQLMLEHTLVNYANMYQWMTWCAVLAALPWTAAKLTAKVADAQAELPAVPEAVAETTEPTAAPATATPPAATPVRPRPRDDDENGPMFWT